MIGAAVDTLQKRGCARSLLSHAKNQACKWRLFAKIGIICSLLTLSRAPSPASGEAASLMWCLLRGSFHDQAVALFEGLTDWQKQCPRSTVYKFIISSYLKDASGHFRGPTPQELSQAAQDARSEVERTCAPRHPRPSSAFRQRDSACCSLRATRMCCGLWLMLGPG